MHGNGMKLLKYLAALLLIVVATFVFVANFSATEARLACSGTIASGSGGKASQIFLKVHEYRWWVGLWSDSDGSIWLEIPNAAVDYYPHVKAVGDELQIREAAGFLRGTLSKLSMTLMLSTPRGMFEGTCKPASEWKGALQ